MIALTLALVLAAQAPVLSIETHTSTRSPGYEAFSKRTLWETAERWRSKAETRARERDTCLESKPQANAARIAMETIPRIEPEAEDTIDPLVIVLGVSLLVATFGAGISVGAAL